MTTLIPKFQQTGTGAVNRPINLKLAETVSILDFGAVADGNGSGGGTDNTAFIQAALNAIVASDTPKQLVIPAGIYRCDTGLIVNIHLVSIESLRGVLDFTNLASTGSALTIIGDTAGNPYKQANAYLRGIEIIGPSDAGAGSRGLYLNALSGGLDVGPSHISLENLNVHGFSIGIEQGNNAYLIDLFHVDFYECDVICYLPSGMINSGSQICFYGGTWYNSRTGLYGASGPTDTHLFGTAIGQLGTGTSGGGNCFQMDAGNLTLHGVHTEGTNKDRLFFVDAANTTLVTITCHGCFFYSNTSLGAVNAYIELNGQANLAMYGGTIFCAAGTTYAIKMAAGYNFIYNGVLEILNGAVIVPPNFYWRQAFGLNDGVSTNMALTANQTISTSGIFAGKASYSITGVDSIVGRGDGFSYMFVVRDNTSGGMTIGTFESGNGVVITTNGTPQITFARVGADFVAKTTGGTANRTISIAYFQCQG
jgi:hypothetical protein